MGAKTYDEAIEERAENEEFRLVMRLLALQLNRAIEAGSDEERIRILVELQEVLDNRVA